MTERPTPHEAPTLAERLRRSVDRLIDQYDFSERSEIVSPMLDAALVLEARGEGGGREPVAYRYRFIIDGEPTHWWLEERLPPFNGRRAVECEPLYRAPAEATERCTDPWHVRGPRNDAEADGCPVCGEGWDYSAEATERPAQGEAEL